MVAENSFLYFFFAVPLAVAWLVQPVCGRFYRPCVDAAMIWNRYEILLFFGSLCSTHHSFAGFVLACQDIGSNAVFPSAVFPSRLHTIVPLVPCLWLSLKMLVLISRLCLRPGRVVRLPVEDLLLLFCNVPLLVVLPGFYLIVFGAFDLGFVRGPVGRFCHRQQVVWASGGFSLPLSYLIKAVSSFGPLPSPWSSVPVRSRGFWGFPVKLGLSSLHLNHSICLVTASVKIRIILCQTIIFFAFLDPFSNHLKGIDWIWEAV